MTQGVFNNDSFNLVAENSYGRNSNGEQVWQSNKKMNNTSSRNSAKGQAHGQGKSQSVAHQGGANSQNYGTKGGRAEVC